MIFSATHASIYEYSRPVFLEPHIMRMRPRHDPFQRLLSFDVTVDPPPAGHTDLLDPNGNAVSHLWFDGETPRLEVTVSLEVETLMTNPFDYLLPSEEDGRLPMHYGAETAALAPCRERPFEMDAVVRFAAGIAEDAGGQVIPFLNQLNTRVYEMVEQEVREDGPPYAADETLEKRQGSCRDSAVLFIAACRAVGIAARFVSGYQEGDRDTDMRHLHAWAEVYLPGGGWRGYDPTHGLLVSDRHISLAAAPEAAGAMPLSGTFRGTGATWEMRYDLNIEVEESTD